MVKMLLDAGAEPDAAMEELSVANGEKAEKAELSRATPLLLAALSMPDCEEPVCQLMPRSPTRTAVRTWNSNSRYQPRCFV